MKSNEKRCINLFRMDKDTVNKTLLKPGEALQPTIL